MTHGTLAVNSTRDNISSTPSPNRHANDSAVVVARGLYNHEAYHTAAVALNIIDNVLLRHLLGDQLSIETLNDPVDRADDMLTKVPVMKETFSGQLVAVVMLFGMSFYTSTFVLFIIQERVSGCLRCESKYVLYVYPKALFLALFFSMFLLVIFFTFWISPLSKIMLMITHCLMLIQILAHLATRLYITL